MKKINLGQKDIIHFVGIGGIGMSGLAQIMNNMGFKIQGSERKASTIRIKISSSRPPVNPNRTPTNPPQRTARGVAMPVTSKASRPPNIVREKISRPK